MARQVVVPGSAGRNEGFRDLRKERGLEHLLAQVSLTLYQRVLVPSGKWLALRRFSRGPPSA